MISLTRKLPHLSILAAPIRLLPDKLTLTPLEKIINHLFAEPVEDGEFDFLENKWVKIDITDVRLTFCLSFDGKKLIADTRPKYDVVFKGSSQAFLTLALRKEDPDTLFFQRKLMIEGDTELGLELKNLLDSIDLEQMPTLVQQALAAGQKVTDRFTKH